MLITSCNYKKVFDSEYYCEKLNFDCIRENQIIIFKTSKGDFEVQLFGKNYPVTVNNFIDNIKKNIYKNKGFYKIINYPQVKVIHSGIYPENANNKKENQKSNKLRPIIPLEIKLKKEIEPKYNFQILDPPKTVDLLNSFEKGSLSMVKSGEINASSTEFFFVTNKFPELDGRYPVFGKVVKGLEILEIIDKKDFIYEIIISN